MCATEVVPGAGRLGRRNKTARPGRCGTIGSSLVSNFSPAPRGGGGSVASVVRCAREAASGGMRHAMLPFQSIVHELLPRRSHDASRNAVFQTMLPSKGAGVPPDAIVLTTELGT